MIYKIYAGHKEYFHKQFILLAHVINAELDLSSESFVLEYNRPAQLIYCFHKEGYRDYNICLELMLLGDRHVDDHVQLCENLKGDVYSHFSYGNILPIARKNGKSLTEAKAFLEYFDTPKGNPFMAKKFNLPKTREIKNVIFNDPATIVFWADGSKTVVKCMEGDTFDPEKGLAMAIIKRVYGDDNSFKKVFKKWLPKQDKLVSVGESANRASKALKNLSAALNGIVPEDITL